jgi:DNA anti-recombination protein RmuC
MRATTLVSLVLAAGLAGACADTETSEEMAMEETFLENREAVDNFRAEARARLGEIDARIQELRARVDSAAGEAKTEVTGAVEEFQSRSGVLAQRLETLIWTDESSWEQMTSQVHQSLDSLRQDVDRALGPNQLEPPRSPDRD